MRTRAYVILLASVTALPVIAQTPDLREFKYGKQALQIEHLPPGDVLTVFVSHADKPLGVLSDPQGLRATRLQFRHTYQPGPGIANWRLATGLALRKLQRLPDWPTVFSYRLTYSDGRSVDIPVRFGEGIREWYRVQTVAPMLWARTHHAHALSSLGGTGVSPVASSDAGQKQGDGLEARATTGEKAVVYTMDVPNPRPDAAITTIEAVPVEDRHIDYGQALILGVSHSNEPLSGKLIFVDRQPIGRDDQPGTFEEPFGTLQKALDTAVPGDTVYVRGGTYALNMPVIKNVEGEAGKWLTLSAFPGESPVLDARHIHFDYRVKPYGDAPPSLTGAMQHDTGAIHFRGDPDYTRIEGMHIVRSTRAGISVSGRPDADSGKPGWASWGATDHIEINFNSTWHTCSMGIISAQTSDIRVLGNRIIRPHSYAMARDPHTGEPMGQEGGAQEAIDLSRCKRFEIGFNTVAGGSKEAIDCISVEDGRIHHNYVLSCLNGIYIDAWTVPIKRLEIDRNFLQDPFNGIPLATEGSNDLLDFRIHHNIIVDSRSTAIGVSEATYKARPAEVSGHRVYHNTIHRPGHFAMTIGWQAAGLSVAGFRDNPRFRDVDLWHNIVTDTAGMPLKNVYHAAEMDHDIHFTRNLVWPVNRDTTPAWVRDSKHWRATDLDLGEDTLVADPQYVDADSGDFRLRAGSPAIGAGTDGEDLGALPHGQAWIAGLDFAGAVTAFYRGETVWEPLRIPRHLFTMHRSNLKRPAWFHSARYGADFRNLPAGLQAWAGVIWHIPDEAGDTAPTVLTLAGAKTESTAESITGIPVGRKAAQLAFLHTAQITNWRELEQNAELFRYRVHYSDGSATDIPIRRGLEIDDWRQRGRARNLADADVAWTQRVRHRRHDEYPSLYRFVWRNPKPDIPIVALDIVRGPDSSDPLHATQATFAISTGN